MHISKMMLKLAFMATAGFVASTASASISPTGGSDCKNRSTYERYSESTVKKAPAKTRVALDNSSNSSQSKSRNGKR